jgi:hypothetical protein
LYRHNSRQRRDVPEEGQIGLFAWQQNGMVRLQFRPWWTQIVPRRLKERDLLHVLGDTCCMFHKRTSCSSRGR